MNARLLAIDRLVKTLNRRVDASFVGMTVWHCPSFGLTFYAKPAFLTVQTAFIASEGIPKRALKSLKRNGEGGIRTLGGYDPTTDFESAAFNRSATSPGGVVWLF